MDQSYKFELYKNVIRVKRFVGFKGFQRGVNLVKTLESTGVKMEALPLKTPGLRGMAAIGKKPYSDVILLNNARTSREQNFDCKREAVHLVLYRHIRRSTLNCLNEVVVPNQDPFLEWQASEGAVEFLMPSREFISMLCDLVGKHPDQVIIEDFVDITCDTYSAPRVAVKYRIESPKRETLQYYAGIKLESMKILSKKQQEKQGSRTESFTDTFGHINEKGHPCGRRNGF